ncbi:MAG: hypothetical protein A2Y23_00485 [Clostridiales bacterium GWB2_37_7]|nr:MAG: hypothetical protein A2Y23_00485 [Clostridiales bacterium GWB2_37_7]
MKKLNVSKILVVCLIVVSMVSASFAVYADSKNVNKLDTGLQYRVDTKGDAYNVKIFIKVNNKNELDSYTSKVKAESADITMAYDNKEVPVTITFKKPLSISEFTSFVEESKINVSEFKIRFLDENNIRTTLGGKPEDGVLIPEDKINELTEKYLTHKMQGVVAAVGTVTVDAANLTKLQNNDKVYLVDASSVQVAEQIKNNKKVKDVAYPTVPDVYWFVEDFNK